MSPGDDEFESVRRETDPRRQGRRATALLAIYQQRMVELARLRREDMRMLQLEGLSYAAVATEFGLSKGRIGQITQTAPPAERALFGVGPVTVALPLGPGGERALPVIASEDALAYDRLVAFLRELLLAVEQLRIPVDGAWTPGGDVIAICGPKSSPVSAAALARDPLLDFREEPDGRWVIADRHDGTRYRSPLDDGQDGRDIAYLGRLPVAGGGTMLLIAGVHALGSVGAVDYLVGHAAELYRQVGERTFSMITASRHDGERVLESEALCPARPHD
ncbi:MAG TPA: sigma-70 family RNA polymerase sigma factor [Mycobacteriales bacterium]